MKTYKAKNKKTGEVFTFAFPRKPAQSDVDKISKQRQLAKESIRAEEFEQKKLQGGLAQKVPEAAIPYLQMFTPEAYVEGAETFGRGVKRVITGEREGLPPEVEYPRVAGAREILGGAFGVVGPPLITAGMVTAPQVTAPTLAAIDVLQRGGEKAIEALGPERIQPELAGLGVDIGSLAIGGRIGRRIEGRIRPRPTERTELVGEGIEVPPPEIPPTTQKVPTQMPLLPILQKRPISSQLKIKIPRQPKVTPIEEAPLPEQLGIEFPETRFTRGFEEPPPIIEIPRPTSPKIPIETVPLPFVRGGQFAPRVEPPVPLEKGMLETAREREITPFRVIDKRRITPEDLTRMEEEVTIVEPRVELEIPSETIIEKAPFVERRGTAPEELRLSTEELIRKGSFPERRVPEKPAPPVEKGRDELFDELAEGQRGEVVGEKLPGERVTPEVEQALSDYDSLLSYVEIESRGNADPLTAMLDVAKEGKRIGKSSVEVMNDISDTVNKERGRVRERHIQRAVNRVFRSEEAGFARFFDKAEEKVKGTEAEGVFSGIKEDIKRFTKAVGVGSSRPQEVVRKWESEGLELYRMTRKAQHTSDTLSSQWGSRAMNALSKLGDKETLYRVARLKNGDEVIVSSKNLDKYVTWENGIMTPKSHVEAIGFPKGSLAATILYNDKPLNANVAEAASLLKSLLNEMGLRGEKAGISTVTSGGKDILFKMMGEDYLPREYTEGFFKSFEKSPKDWNRIVKEIAEKNNISLIEAEKLLQARRNYGELVTRGQHQRTFHQESFIVDPEVLFRHIHSFADRVGAAEGYGPKDVRGPQVRELLIGLQEKGYDWRFAQEMIERVVGREQSKGMSREGRFVNNLITDLNNARLMIAFPIHNIGGVTPLISHTGVGNVLSGAAARLANMEVTRNMAILSGVRRAQTIERGASPVARAMGVPQSEAGIRTYADTTSRIALVEDLDVIRRLDPQSRRYEAHKAYLDWLVNKDSTEMIRRGYPTPEEANFAAWSIASETQGRPSPSTLPFWAQDMSNIWLTNLSLQYKRMTFLGTASLIKSLRMPRTRYRTIGAILAAGPIIGEILGDASSSIFGGTTRAIVGEENFPEAMLREMERRGEVLAPFTKSIPGFKVGVDVAKLLHAPETIKWLAEGVGFPNVKKMSDEELVAWAVGRYLEDLNRGFALGVIGDMLYAMTFSGRRAIGDVIAGGLGPTFEFLWDVVRAATSEQKDMLDALLPPKIGSARARTKREEEREDRPGVRIPTVELPSLPSP